MKFYRQLARQTPNIFSRILCKMPDYSLKEKPKPANVAK